MIAALLFAAALVASPETGFAGTVPASATDIVGITKTTPLHLPDAYLKDPQAFCDMTIWIAEVAGHDFSDGSTITAPTDKGTLVCSRTKAPRLTDR